MNDPLRIHLAASSRLPAVDWTIPVGVSLLCGPACSGKSTLLQAVAHEHPPRSIPWSTAMLPAYERTMAEAFGDPSPGERMLNQAAIWLTTVMTAEAGSFVPLDEPDRWLYPSVEKVLLHVAREQAMARGLYVVIASDSITLPEQFLDEPQHVFLTERDSSRYVCLTERNGPRFPLPLNEKSDIGVGISTRSK